MARGARDRRSAGLGAGAMARGAFLHGGDADAGFGAARRVLERDLQVIAQVRAAIDAGAAATAAENVPEDVAEGLGEIAEAGAGSRRRGGIHAGVPELVVG